MYCKYCGKEIDDNSNFCRFCGKETVETKKEVTVTEEDCNLKKSEVIPILGVLCIIGILVYLFALTISSEILHNFGLTRDKQLNTDISSCIGIIAVIISAIKLFTFKNKEKN